jgi:hypothetical protein
MDSSVVAHRGEKTEVLPLAELKLGFSGVFSTVNCQNFELVSGHHHGCLSLILEIGSKDQDSKVPKIR